MRTPTPLALVLGATVALMAAGSAAAAASNACFWTHSVDNFASVDPSTVYIRANGRQVFELKLFAPCLDVDWSHRIAIRSRSGSTICEGRNNNAEILVRSLGRRQRCPITSVRRLTPEEVGALPARARP